MVKHVTGRIVGEVITLDSKVPALDGARVRVHLEPIVDSDTMLSAEAQESAWSAWVSGEPQGPISDEDALAP